MNTRYTDLELIGTGSFGQVYRANDKQTKKQVAIKRIPKTEDAERIESEIKAGILLVGISNIVQYKECLESNNSYWMIFEYFEGTNMYEHLNDSHFKPQQEKFAKNIMRQLLGALEQMHAKGVAHKDIKLENIMYNQSSKEATFIDFGLASIYENGSACTDFCGSKEYCSPEVKAKQAFVPEKADVWSLGVTLYTILYGLFPFSPKDLKTHKDTGVHPIPYFPLGRVSDEARDFLSKMLQIEPSSRASIRELLNHTWLKQSKSIFGKRTRYF